MEIDAEVLAHYAEGREHSRLTSTPSLELLRTRVLLERFLPAPPARVLDVGGASGVYASWLSDRGYQVHLVDPVPLHREQARADGRFSVAPGDARSLAEDDASYDAVLLLGPLYHLTERTDRVRALAEARRVTRPGGIIAAAVISRYASTFDGFFRGFTDKPGFTALMTEDLKTGQHRNPGSEPGFFTTAYFHDRAGIASEVTDSGLRLHGLLPVEGMLHWAPGIQDRLSDPAQRQLILDTLAAMEHDPAIAGATGHLLAIAQRPLDTQRTFKATAIHARPSTGTHLNTCPGLSAITESDPQACHLPHGKGAYRRLFPLTRTASRKVEVRADRPFRRVAHTSVLEWVEGSVHQCLLARWRQFPVIGSGTLA